MLFAIVPAYQESARIARVVSDLSDHVDRVVVIDDASTDDTVDQACAAGAVVLRHHVNRGQGAALETGHAYARKHGAEYVLHFDGDGQFSVHDIGPALQALKKAHADVLFGSRFLDDRTNMPWAKRHVIFPISRLVNRLFVPLPLTDIHNGFRILTKEALDHIAISQDRMAHASELPAQVGHAGLRWIEFPVEVTYHEFGQGIRGGIHILKELIFGKFI
jgi:glycosyltransferase involved in cell wall biosynthesis